MEELDRADMRRLREGERKWREKGKKGKYDMREKSEGKGREVSNERGGKVRDKLRELEGMSREDRPLDREGEEKREIY